MLMNNRKKNTGFSLLELTLSIAIFAGASIATGYLIIDAGTATDINSKKIEATFLAHEGLESLRSIRDNSGFSALTVGTNQGLAFATSTGWSLVASPDVSADGLYTRRIDISSLGDSHFKVASSTVTVQSGNRQISTSLTTEFTDWR